MNNESSQPLLRIFISHRDEDRSLAEKIRDKLVILSHSNIEAFLFNDIQGGEKWQEKIESELREAQMLMFLFTDDKEEWRWCLYETGFFKGSKENNVSQIVCIKNKDVDSPDPLQCLQAYNSDHEGIQNLLLDMIKRGKFTNNKPINNALDADKAFKEEFVRAVDEIVEEFAEARKYIDFFDKRININLHIPRQHDQPVTMDKALITGEIGTLKMLGIDSEANWNQLVEEQGDDGKPWLDAISDAVSRIQDKKAPNQIMPSMKSKNNRQSYTPLLSRIERVGIRPERLSIIFVETDQLITKEDMPDCIPDKYKSALALLNIALQFRWKVLQNFMHMLKIKPKNDLKKLCEDILCEIDFISEHAKKLGFENPSNIMHPLKEGQNEEIISEALRVFVEGEEMLRDNLEQPTFEIMKSALEKIDSSNKQFITLCAQSIELSVK